MKHYWEHRSSSDGERRSEQALASQIRTQSERCVERQRPLTDALSKLVAGFCEDDSMEGSLADTLSSHSDLWDVARDAYLEESGDEDLAGQELLLLQHALERDAELWWKMQRRLIRLIMRVAKKREQPRLTCGHDCSVCAEAPGKGCDKACSKACGLACSKSCGPDKATHPSKLRSPQVQDEPAREPEAGCL